MKPSGPKAEKRPADIIGNAVKIMRIATGEESDELPDDGNDPAAKALGKKGRAARAFPREFFFLDDVDPIDPTAASFRSLTTMSH